MMKRLMGVSMICTALAVCGAVPTPANASPNPTKTNVCHREGNGSYNLINVSTNAVPAHLAHGDGLPGDSVQGGILGDDCSVIATQIVRSATLNFSGGGWGGWSCPAGTKIVSATVEKNGGTGDGLVAELDLWKPGATTQDLTVSYPNTPFGYTYTPPEQGAIARNNSDNDSLVIVLVCTI